MTQKRDSLHDDLWWRPWLGDLFERFYSWKVVDGFEPKPESDIMTYLRNGLQVSFEKYKDYKEKKKRVWIVNSMFAKKKKIVRMASTNSPSNKAAHDDLWTRLETNNAHNKNASKEDLPHP